MRDEKFFIDNYLGDTCACGGDKGRRLSFCFGCYGLLPEHLQESLTGELTGYKYMTAWEECHDYLVEEGRIRE